MKRVMALFLALMLAPAAFADPLSPAEDFSDTVTICYNGKDFSDGRYIYTYRYPSVEDTDENDLSSVSVNEYYRKKVQEYTDFYIPSQASEYAGYCMDVDIDISYQITCNNDDCFSVLIRKKENVGGEITESWEGNTFSRSSQVIGSLTSLPRLLGLVEDGESDDWLEDRQSRKVWEVLCSLVWNAIQDNPDEIPYNPDLTKDDLEYIIDPVLSLDQDFYMDSSGNPVFFILPGRAAPADIGLLTFPFTLDQILDEL